MFHDLDRIEKKVFWIEIFDRMTGFSGLTGEAEGVWTEFTELIELERSRFIICLSAGISGSLFFE